MLKHRGVYFAIISQACCFCSSGASAFVYTAASPLGPFTLHNDIQIPGGSAPPAPPAPAVKAEGPKGERFCGGVGGQEAGSHPALAPPVPLGLAGQPEALCHGHGLFKRQDGR